MTLEPQAETFLKRLRMALGALPQTDRQEIIAELRSHLEERGAGGVTALLEGYGEPETYAAQFLAERSLRGALARGTSWELARASLVGLRDSLLALLALVPLVLLQLFGGVFVVLAAVKPFAADHVGVIFRDGRLLHIGYATPLPAGTREVLGWWGVPVFAIGGALLLWVGNRGMRTLVRWRLARVAARRT